jgi:hypothetical protein
MPQEKEGGTTVKKYFVILAALFVFAVPAIASAGCSQAITTSFKETILNGTQTNSSDTFKAALYTQAAASLDASTTAYPATGEVSGTGYTAGGATMSGFTVGSSGTTAWIDFTTDPSWPNSTITADCALIYDSSASNAAMMVLTFASTSSTNGTWTLVFPTADASNALLRLALKGSVPETLLAWAAPLPDYVMANHVIVD